ncbi:MAG: peptidoglycan DD-metalloendopeptidase family protein [Alphaproteobacteria bacterium]|nr:peptidoglycan DD-metalloendopeptidase family protein [Alphaproteobacteria bacterium]
MVQRLKRSRENVRHLGGILGVGLAAAISVGTAADAYAARGKVERTQIAAAAVVLPQSVAKTNVPVPANAPVPANITAPANVTAPTPALALAPAPRPGYTQRLLLESGENLFNLLLRHGIPAEDVTAATQAIGELYDMRRIKPGDAVVVSRGAKTGTPAEQHLTALQLVVPDGPGVSVVRGEDGHFGKPAGTPATIELHRRTLVLNSDLRRVMKGTALPASVSYDILRAAKMDPAFPTQTPKGAKLTVVYEVPTKTPGAPAILRYASLKNSTGEHRLYRYPMASSKVAYLDEQGKGVAVVSLNTPIGTRPEISSGWGWRIHPVLGHRKFHRGVDFRAPRGTPALAAADGVIDDMGWRGNYGLYIRIRHGGNLSTAYAHLDHFATTLHKGSIVHKGQQVGYVGTTGLATGPHLYYEVLVDNHQINPLQKTDMAIPVRLQDNDLAVFRRYVQFTGRIIED